MAKNKFDIFIKSTKRDGVFRLEYDNKNVNKKQMTQPNSVVSQQQESTNILNGKGDGMNVNQQKTQNKNKK